MPNNNLFIASPRRGIESWGTLCFALLAANNLVVIADWLLLSDYDLSVPRLALSLMAGIILLFGFIWDGER